MTTGNARESAPQQARLDPDVVSRVPDKPSLDGIGKRWSERWETDGTYRFD